jgi:hypothetical protein
MRPSSDGGLSWVQILSSWLHLSFPKGFKKVDDGRLFLIAISTVGTADEIAGFRKEASGVAFHLVWRELLSTKGALLKVRF